jgi:hypothetical protein
MGACAPNPGAPCTGGYLCSSSTACATACGTTAGDVGCQSTYYCDGMGAGTCVAKLPSGSACTQGYECQSGMCNAMSGTRCN